jgi:hypothetical protein
LQQETSLKLTAYTEAFDCEGAQVSESYSTSEVRFDCTSSKGECGKLYGFKTPCDCTKEGGDCRYAYALSIVDEICVPYSNSLSTPYQQWEITCGSVDKANAKVSLYSDTACNSYLSATTTAAGCHTDADYVAIYGDDELDRIVCPANIQSFSIALAMALIAASFSM